MGVSARGHEDTHKAGMLEGYYLKLPSVNTSYLVPESNLTISNVKARCIEFNSARMLRTLSEPEMMHGKYNLHEVD